MAEVKPIPEDQKGFQCNVLCASVNGDGDRITSMRLKYPLIVHAEFCRHRAFSRSVASNRAIPTPRIVQMVQEDPFIPLHWGKSRPGMQAGEELTGHDLELAKWRWDDGRREAIRTALHLQDAGLHKQIANRVLTPYQWVTEVVTATHDGWSNFFALRCHPAAEPHMQKIAFMARDAYFDPQLRVQEVPQFSWHLPYVTSEEQQQLLGLGAELAKSSTTISLTTAAAVSVVFGLGLLQTRRGSELWLAKAVSAARVARTSYRTHDGRKSTVEEDLGLYVRLVGSQPRHASPTEHQAYAVTGGYRFANFKGWLQYRLEIPDHTIEDYSWPNEGS